jgi:hypothetical protein
MKPLLITLIITILTFSQKSYACDCGSNGEFLKVAPKSQLVALVKVKKYLTFKKIYDEQTPMSMEVEVISIYKGKEKRKILKIWGDNGNLCRPYLSQFKTGEYYIIAFTKGSDGTQGHVHDDERITDYTISICGNYWLRVDIKSQKAFGSVTDKISEITIKDLKAKLQ